MGAVLVLMNVAVTSGVSGTSAILCWPIGILKACAPSTIIANVCTLLEAPVRVCFRLRPVLANAM